MDRVVEVANVDEPDSHTDERDDLGQLLPELIKLLLQGGLVLLGSSHLISDLANLSTHTSGGHDAHGLAGCNVGALGRRGGDRVRQEVILVLQAEGGGCLSLLPLACFPPMPRSLADWLTAY